MFKINLSSNYLKETRFYSIFQQIETQRVYCKILLSTNNSSSSEAPHTAKCAIAEPLEQRRIGNKVKINHWQYKYILNKDGAKRHQAP